MEREFLNLYIERDHMLSSKERKQPLQFYGDYFYFYCEHADLTSTLEISVIPSREQYLDFNNYDDLMMKYSIDLMHFSSEWTQYVFEYLDGFIGLDNVEIKLGNWKSMIQFKSNA